MVAWNNVGNFWIMVGRDIKSPQALDKGLFILSISLTALGVIAVADVSSPQALAVFSDSFHFAKQQLVWAVVGIILLIIGAVTNYKVWQKTAWPLFIISIVLLILVILPGFGTKVLGAQRWLMIGPIRFQPSELVKLTIAIFFAKTLGTEERPYWFYLGAISLVFLLVMLQPDLGTTIVIIAIAVSQLFVAGLPILYLLGTMIAGSSMGAILILLSSYRRARLMTFLESSADPLGSSYHIRQILIAIGSGGLFGLGIGQSRQKHLFLPETATDSVFAVLAEEIGFLGASLIIMLLFVYIFKAIKIAQRAPDRFSTLLAGGISVWIGIQILLNLASMVALVPLTGIPLPFFSYGGSSLMMVLFSTGILLNISKHGQKK